MSWRRDLYELLGPGSLGHQQYGEEFQGDLLKQAIKEQVDSL